jgi:Tol biopolymer transport system component
VLRRTAAGIAAAATAAGLLALATPAGAAPTCSLARVTNAAQDSRDPDISADGSAIVFRSEANLTGQNPNNSTEIFRRQGGTTTQITPDTGSFNPSVNGDGSIVAFESSANIGGQNNTTTNNVWRWTGGSSFSNISGNGAVGLTGSPSISDTGNAVAFVSDGNLTASNPEVNVELFRWTLFGPPNLVQRTNSGAGAANIEEIEISGQGSSAVFSTTRNLTGGNADGSREVFRWDVTDGIDQLSNTPVSGGGGAELPSISYDGSVVTFDARGQSAVNAQEIWRWVDGEGLERITEVGGTNTYADVDGSGNRISFFSTADHAGTNPDGQQELFRWDANTGDFVQATQGSEHVAQTQIDGVGARVVFESGDPLLGANADGEQEVYRATCATFTDVPANHQFFTDVEWMAAFGISTGNPDGTYRPTSPVSRSAMAAFLYRLAGEPLGPFPDPGFSDVDGHPFEEEISWMADAEVAGGYEDGTFRPAAPVSRAAMSAFLYRMSSEPPGPFPNPGFSDVAPAHPFFFEISWMADQEITGGYADGTFKPAAPVSRQAMAAFLHRFWDGPGIP